MTIMVIVMTTIITMTNFSTSYLENSRLMITACNNVYRLEVVLLDTGQVAVTSILEQLVRLTTWSLVHLVT